MFDLPGLIPQLQVARASNGWTVTVHNPPPQLSLALLQQQIAKSIQAQLTTVATTAALAAKSGQASQVEPWQREGEDGLLSTDTKTQIGEAALELAQSMAVDGSAMFGDGLRPPVETYLFNDKAELLAFLERHIA